MIKRVSKEDRGREAKGMENKEGKDRVEGKSRRIRSGS